MDLLPEFAQHSSNDVSSGDDVPLARTVNGLFEITGHFTNYSKPTAATYRN